MSTLRWASGADRDEALAALGVGIVGRRCSACGSTAHGQPYALGEGCLSLAHAEGLVLAALCSAGPVGIDLEPIGRVVERAVVAHPSETGDPLRLWVRKEAVLKATGQGLRVAPESWWLEPDGSTGPIPGYDGPALRVHDLELPGFVAAVAGRAEFSPEAAAPADRARRRRIR